MKRTISINRDMVRDHAVSLLSPVKDQGYDSPGTTGGTAVCYNLRMRGDRLVAVGEPERMALSGRRPVYTDIREGVTYLFTQEDDGTLYVEPCPQPYPSQAATEAGRVRERVESGASVGEFVVFRLESGRLAYLRHEPGSGRYRWLGGLPELPAFSLTAELGTAMSAEMESTRFARPLTSLSNPVEAEVSGKVEQAWKAAWERLAAGIRAAGRWLEPVRMRLALRMWDGSLLHVSEPVRITPPVRAARDRVQVGLLWDEGKKGFTGTDSATLSAHGYTVSLTMKGELPAVWAGIVAGIEVWVSREPETLSADRSPVMSYIHDNKGNHVSFIPATRTLADIDGDADRQPTGLLRFIAAGQTTGGRLYHRGDVTWDSRVEDYATPMPGTVSDTACILGYGEFLHAGSGDTLCTSMRGNPFVMRDMTRGLGGRVRSLRPQRCGGGAFTRQYIYVSTDRGVVALCHKADGGHTNSRPVSQEPLAHGELWCSTPRGVYALTAGGSLLRLKDATAPVVFTRLCGVTALLWSNTREELWICAGQGTLVMQDEGLYTRPESYVPLPGVFSPALVFSHGEDGICDIRSLDSETPGTDEASLELEVPLDGNGWLRMVRIFMTGEAGIRYRFSNAVYDTLCTGKTGRPTIQGLDVAVPLASLGARPASGQRRLTVSLHGRIKEISKIRVTG